LNPVERDGHGSETAMISSESAALLGVILFPAAMVFAGLMDLATMKIRNSLVIALGFAWVVLAPLAGFTLAEMAGSAAVAGTVLVVTFVFFARGWIGGGDAKLAAVSALWFQPSDALLYFAYASLLGGLLTLAILQLRAQMLPSRLVALPWLANLHDPKAGVPYGAAMAPAALITFPESAWLVHAAI